jgi:CRISPR-associated protein Csb1
MNSKELLSKLHEYVTQAHAAVRLRVDLQPVGGPGDKFFPPTYEGGSYAEERRVVGDRDAKAVLLNSVPAEAARLEAALKQGLEEKEVEFPAVALNVPGFGRLLELDLPHRVFDAYLVHAEVDGVEFWETAAGKEIHAFQRPNATGLYRQSPVTLLFGGWDTHALDDKSRSWRFRYPRALVSEIVAYDVSEPGTGTSSKGDPFNLSGTLYEAKGGGWTPSQAEARNDDKGNPVKYVKPDGKATDAGKPSPLGLGQITPSFISEDGKPKPGGYTAREIRQIAVLSFPALRRLRFPEKPDGANDEKRNQVGRVVLAALGLYALAKSHAEGFWLRSRCHLVASGTPELEFVRADGSVAKAAIPGPEVAAEALKSAVGAAEAAGLVWRKKPLLAVPSKPLGDLIRQQGIQ